MVALPRDLMDPALLARRHLMAGRRGDGMRCRMVTQKCVGVTQQCVGWRMGDRLHRGVPFGEARQGEALWSHSCGSGAGFVHHAMIADSPGFVRLLGSFGFPPGGFVRTRADCTAVRRGTYADPAWARDRRRAPLRWLPPCQPGNPRDQSWMHFSAIRVACVRSLACPCVVSHRPAPACALTCARQQGA
jgi:hypothetical protein